MSALVRIAVVCLVLSGALGRAQEPPEPVDGAPPSPAELQAENDREARLRFIEARLQAEAVQARVWEAGWSIVYIGGFAYSGYELAHAHDAAATTEGAIGAARSVAGGMVMGLRPLKASRGAHELDRAPAADDSAQRLQLAESLLRRNAVETERRYSWKPHVLMIGVNLLAGAAIWLAGDGKRGAESAGISIAVGELRIWTQPWQAKRDWREYRQRFGSDADNAAVARPLTPSPALRVSPTQLAVTF